MRSTVFSAVIAAFLIAPSCALAQKGPKDDNSGTNPINFTNDFRIIAETQDLPGGDNTYTQLMFEYRAPLSETVAVRFRGPIGNLSVESEDGPTNFTGLADASARILWVPKATSKWAIATGLEASFDTAMKAPLGAGRTTLGPQVFLPVFNFLGVEGMLFSPAYQYVFDVAGDDGPEVSRSQVDLFFLWLAPSKKNWVMFNPQIILDHERETETMIIETELGQMMFGATSSYIRPGFHASGDRLYDWNLEFGFKVIWR